MPNFNPQPKQFREKKPRQPLHSKSGMKTKSRIKQGKGNPFPDSIKKQTYEEQGGICEHPDCTNGITDYHHRKKKGMGSSVVWWIHDRRQCSGLCRTHHRLTEENMYWLLFYEALGVVKFGWSAGEEITLDEWIDRNEYRLRKANIEVERLCKEVREKIETG